MHALLKYLNNLPVARQTEFATSCATSVSYLRKACSKNQKLGAEICVAIERESGGKVTRKQLRPDDWQSIWPELVERKKPAAA